MNRFFVFVCMLFLVSCGGGSDTISSVSSASSISISSQESSSTQESSSSATSSSSLSSVSLEFLMGGAIQTPLDNPTVVSTLAGFTSGDGVGAAVYIYPGDMVSDGVNLYVADPERDTIRKVIIATGEVTTLAGNASQVGYVDGIGAEARFHDPIGITLVGGDLYVTDSFNHAIRKIVVATGEVTTVAGSGVAGLKDGTGVVAQFGYPSKIATDGTNLYVLDNYGVAIRKIVIATGEVSTFAKDFKLYSRISMTFIGTDMYVASNFSVRKYDTTTGTVTRVIEVNNMFPITPTFGHAISTTTDGSNLFMLFRNYIIKIEISTGKQTTIAKVEHQDIVMSNSIVFDGLHLFTGGSGLIQKIQIATGEITDFLGHSEGDGIDEFGRFGYVEDIITDGTNLYVADQRGIKKVEIATGRATTVMDDVVNLSATIGGMTTDGENLYVSDSAGGIVKKVKIIGTEVSVLAGKDINDEALFQYPTSITTDGVNLYVIDSGMIRKIMIDTGEVTTVGIGTEEFSAYSGITTDGSYLYIADINNHTIYKVEISAGDVITLAGAKGVEGDADGVGGAARFNKPRGIVTDGSSLYVADGENRTIRKIVISTGEVTTLAGTPGVSGYIDDAGTAAQFGRPVDITTDGTDLFVTDDYKRLRRIQP